MKLRGGRLRHVESMHVGVSVSPHRSSYCPTEVKLCTSSSSGGVLCIDSARSQLFRTEVKHHPSLFAAVYIMGCQICQVSGGGGGAVGTLRLLELCVHSSSRPNSITGIKSSLRRRQISEILAAGRLFSQIAEDLKVWS